MKKLRQEKVKLFVLVKSSSRWEFCKTKGDAIKFITRLSNAYSDGVRLWMHLCLHSDIRCLLSTETSLPKTCAKERILIGHLEACLLFLLIFNFFTSKCIKRGES